MSSRRIPISSNQRATQQQQQQSNRDNQTTPFRSSLDLVFSFSRSAGFFGENLPTGPSFVDQDRYRPEGYDDDQDSTRGGSHERDPTTSTNEDDTDELDQDEVDVTWEGEGEGEGEENESTTNQVEQLPRNAKGSIRRQPSPATKQQQQQPPPSILANPSTSPPPAPSSSSRPPPLLHAQFLPPPPPPSASASPSERTPLLSQSPALSKPHSPPDSIPFPRRSPQVDQQPAQNGPRGRKGSIGGTSSVGARQRRGSTFSRENWKAAIEEHRGESTWGQTLFNTVNVLVGVGLLADPLAFAYGGWILGVLLLLFCALVTNYTAKMLASLMRLDPTQHTYADVLIKAFGPRSRRWIYALFVVELGTFSVAAIELFADSLSSLFPRISSNVFKIFSYFILVPTTFLPLRLLSLTSLLGILSSVVLLAVIIADGTIKRESPGSLWDPMETNAGPNWKKLPICFGLMMSGFSGHAVVPSLYRDMKNPQHFASMINVAYIIAFSVSLIFAVLGYVMFGNGVSAEITKDLSKTVGYPVALTKVAVWMVAINPLVKYAVANKPLVATFEHLIGLHPPAPPPPAPSRPPMTSALSTSSSESGVLFSSTLPQSDFPSRSSIRPSTSSIALATKSRRIQLIRYWVLRPVLSIVFVLVAIAIPDFDRVLSFLGSASAFVICCIGPIGAYLILSVPEQTSLSTEEGGGGGGYSKIPSSVGGGILGRQDPELIEEISQIVDPSIAQRHLIEGVGRELVVGKGERVVCWILLVVSIVMASVGTVWSFLPEF